MRGVVPQIETAAKSDDGDNRKLVREGDFVINSRSDRRGSAGLSKLDGSVSLIDTVLMLGEQVHPGFCNWLLRSVPFQQEFYRWGQGIVADLWTTRFSEMRAITLALPPLFEQIAIAEFLDHEIGKIDALVEEQRRLITLLKEKRQAVVSHAVTKGLDPNAPLKDSGVEWLGEVPKHWNVTKLGRYISILSGFAFPSAGFSLDEGDVRLLRGVNVAVGTVRWDEVVYWKRSSDDDLDRFAVREGQIVVGMDRPWIAEGVRVAKVTSADVPSLLLQRVTALTAKGGMTHDHLYAVLSSNNFVDYFTPDMTGVSVPHLSPEQIDRFVVAVPPLDEQVAIADSLGAELPKLDALLVETEKALALLAERRAALISAAVTGKIDVRSAERDEVVAA